MFDEEGSQDPSPTQKDDLKKEDDPKYNSSPVIRKTWSGIEKRNSNASNQENQYQKERTPNQKDLTGKSFDLEKMEDFESNQNSAYKYNENSDQKKSYIQPQDKVNLEEVLEAEKEKLTVLFQKEMEEKLKDLDDKLSEHWSKKYDEIQKSYENRIHQYEELLQSSQLGNNDEGVQQDILKNLEREISEKYHQQYLDKIEEIQQNFKTIEEANLMQIVEEIKKELEAQYSAKYNEQVQTLRDEAKRELEKFHGESNSKWSDHDDFQKMLGIDVKSSVEKSLRDKFEQEKEALIKKYMQEQNALKKEITTMENKIKEKLEIEVKEELEKEYNRKEKLMNLNWRKKMETYKKELEGNLEQEMRGKLENERKDIEKAKVEISRIKSLENVRLKKAEDGKKALEQKLKEQEDKYEKMINNLKKQIEQLNLGEDDRISQSTKRMDNTKSMGNNSLTRSGRQPLASPFENQGVSESYLKKSINRSEFEKYNDLSRSRSQSPVEDQRNKALVFQRGESSDEKTNLQKKPLIQAALTLRNRPENISKDEPNKTILNMIDPMAPPELFSQENKPKIDFPFQERESISEDKKFPIIQNSEDGSSYEALKAQIMKKYSPQKRTEGSFTPERNIDGSNQKVSKQLISSFQDEYGLESNMSSQPFGRDLIKGNKKENLVPTDFNEEGREANKEESFMKKYEAILQKYSKEGFAKDKYKSLASSTASNFKEGASQNADTTKQDKFQSMFEIKPEDDQKTKDFKKQKKAIQNKIEKDNGLESKYLAREIYFTTDFLTKTNIETTGQQKTLKNSLKTLYDLWNEIETSYQARLSFLDNIELISEYESLMKKITLEIDYLKVTQKNIGEIMGYIKKRNYYREQINTDNFDYKKYKKLYFAIDANNMDLRRLLDPYKRKYNKEALYKGIEVCEMIKVDAWEHEHLQKLELKDEILDKIRRKF